MKLISTLCFLILPLTLGLTAEPRGSTSPAASGKLFIFSEGGATVSPTNVVYRKSVKVFESDMYLECELLTMTQQTNRPSAPGGGGGLTNINAQADIIIAETNVLMMARGTSVMGDRAVYTKATETIEVTGELVAIVRSNLLFFSTNFVFNITNNSGYAVGWTDTEVEFGGRTNRPNVPRPGIGPLRKPNPAPTNPPR